MSMSRRLDGQTFAVAVGTPICYVSIICMNILLVTIAIIVIIAIIAITVIIIITNLNVK